MVVYDEPEGEDGGIGGEVWCEGPDRDDVKLGVAGKFTKLKLSVV